MAHDDASLRPRRSLGDLARYAADTLPELAIAEVSTAPTDPPADPPAGDAELKLGEVLGVGGMGIVRVAAQRSLHREVAVKRVREEVADPAARLALIEEAVITGRVEHPAVIPVHALGRDSAGAPVLVMKRVEGVSWRKLIRTPNHAAWSKVTGDRLVWHLGVLIRVANAVHFAHSKRIVHRDLKPDNVMIGSFGEVYVLDWGIALELDAVRAALVPQADQADGSESTSGASVDALAGTPGYMAPEMARGALDQIDERTDVYLLGAMLHEVLTGRPRHDGDNVAALVASALESKPFNYESGVPRTLGAIANRACSADPSARFGSADELRRALESFLEHRASLALSEQSLARFLELDGRLAGASASSLDPLPIYKLFGECRFGFLQALRGFPNNEDAARGLERAIERMVFWELSRKNVPAAGALLADLPNRRTDLETRIEALRLNLVEEQEEIQTLRRNEKDRDISVGARVRLMLFVGASVLVLVLVELTMHVVETNTISLEQSLRISLAYLALLAVGAFFLRKKLLANSAGRRLSLVFALIAAILPIHRMAAIQLDWPVTDVLITDILFLALGAGLVGVTMDRRAVPAAVFLLCAFVFASINPERIGEIFPISTVSSLLILAWGWRRRGQRG